MSRDPNCQACELWENAETPCYWGAGPTSADLMIIGEFPSREEDRNGKPGRGGKLLRQLMDEVGLTQKTYKTHCVKCLPPEDHKIKATELKACRPYLQKELETVQAPYILLLGATALKALTKKIGITELHGQVLEIEGRKFFPTFHPAMALRDPSKLPLLRRDLGRLQRIITGNLESVEDIHWEVIRTLDQWNVFIDEFRQSRVTSFDIETTGLKRKAPDFAINSIQFGLDSGRNWSLPLSVRDSPWKDKRELHLTFLTALVEASEGVEMVGQNAKFDNTCLMEVYGLKFRLGFDTMLASHTLDENRAHGLKELSVDLCDAPAYDVDLKTKLGQGNLEKFYKYGCLDAFYTRKIRDIFRQQLLREPSLRRLFYKLVMPVARMFEEIEMEGHFLNVPLLEERRRTLTRKRDAFERKLNQLAGRPVNWGSPKQVADLLFGDLGLEVLDKTGTGAPSTSESVLLRIDHPIAKLLIKMRGVEKNLSTYINGWDALRDGPYLYLSTKLHGTVTGRYASRLHQVPRDPLIRSLIDAPPGWTFVCADYSQIELRLAAMASGDPRMMQAFQTGQDLHRLTASEALGVPPEQVTKHQRKMAKAINFGFIYGMWYKKFVIYARDNYGVDVTLEEGKAFRLRFFELYSKLTPWHERCKRTVRALGYVTSLSGRRRRLPGVLSSEDSVRQEAERQAINSPIQGFGSGDLKAMALLEVHHTFSRDVLRIKGEVHDSNLMWIRTEKLAEIIPQVKKIMEHPKLLDEFGIRMTVPLVVDFEVGPWGLGETYNV